MEVVAWLLAWVWWVVSSVFGLAWSLVWFLISGWVSTALQILIVIGIIYVVKYGWRQAPIEMMRHGRTSGRMFWNWLRARDGGVQEGRGAERVREVVRVVRAGEFGDINVSTLMTLLMLGGMAWIAVL